MTLLLPLTVWSGHSCPLPLTLILILPLTLTGKGTTFSRAAKRTEQGTRLQPLRERLCTLQAAQQKWVPHFSRPLREVGTTNARSAGP